MCGCETDDKWLTHVALSCPKCKKCPVHCGCYEEECTCYKKGFTVNTMRLLGHRLDCPARIESRKQFDDADDGTAVGRLAPVCL
jgi:hypothetical protein